MKKKKISRVILCTIVILIAAAVFITINYLFDYAMMSKKYSHMNINSGKQTKQVIALKNEREEWFKNQKFEKIHMNSDDGIKLSGYFLPADSKTNRLAVIAHGYGGSAESMADYERYYHLQGFNVFAADDRGHGESEGRFIGMGWTDRKDYIKWIKLLIKKLGPDTQIVLHGESMGGATVMMMSGENLPANVKCIIEDCGYTSIKDEFDYQIKQMFKIPSFPLVDFASIESKIRLGFSFSDASALKEVQKSKTPMFFIHGADDDFVPTKMVYQVYDAAKCAKQLWVVPKAKHAKSFIIARDEYEKRIRNFYNKYLSK